MSDDAEHRRCPACGKDNRCAIDAQGECWCATEFPPQVPLAPNAEAACYCRECLRKLIESTPGNRPGS